MEDNKVKSFVVQKRIILTRVDGDNNVVTSVYYDESNWDSLKAIYPEDALYPSKKELLNLGEIVYRLDSGNLIKVYDLERTICDVIKNKK